MIEPRHEQCLPDLSRMVQTLLETFSTSDMSKTTGEATAKQKREWLPTDTTLGLSLWWAHRTTTVKCSTGHVRHATASEQLPLGQMLDALRAPPMPLCRDLQVPGDVFMDLGTTVETLTCWNT